MFDDIRLNQLKRLSKLKAYY
ncbi:hypothetical protein [Niallia sp. FSL W8-0635]